MGDEKKYKVLGYHATTDPDWKQTRRFIGSVDEVGEALKLKENAMIDGWGTVLILDGDSIVE
jgi:hypothetical protein